MRHLIQRIARFSSVIIALALLSGCATAIVPQYQQSLVDGINQANTKALTLFSSISTGSPQSQYATYKPKYDEVIGTFDALRLAAKSRPVPALNATLAALGPLKDLCKDEADPTACVNSTAQKLQGIVDVMSELKRVHGKLGLQPSVVAFYRLDYQQSVLDALTIENALKR